MIYLEARLQRAEEQRLRSLKNALDTIRCLAEPTLDPELFEAFEKIEKRLTDTYSKLTHQQNADHQ